MSMFASTSTQQPAAICALKSPADAIHVLEAVRLGMVPRVTRRLTGHERSMIRPGTVWVWEEEETNMRRWTDGRRWGASRVGGGGFLVYTESPDPQIRSPPPPERSDSPMYQNGYQYASPSRRMEGLIKQTYTASMTHPANGKVQIFHVVAYSSQSNPQGEMHNSLPLPQQLPLLANLRVTPGIWPDWEHRREQDRDNARRTGYTPLNGQPSSVPVSSAPSPSTSISTLSRTPARLSPARDLALRNYGQPSPSLYPLDRDPRQSYSPAYYTPPPGRPDQFTPFSRPDPYSASRSFPYDRMPSAPHAAQHPTPPLHPTPTQQPTSTQQSSERYHPYNTPARSDRTPLPTSTSASSFSSTSLAQGPITPQHTFFENERGRERGAQYPPSPPQSYRQIYLPGVQQPFPTNTVYNQQGREYYLDDPPLPRHLVPFVDGYHPVESKIPKASMDQLVDGSRPHLVDGTRAQPVSGPGRPAPQGSLQAPALSEHPVRSPRMSISSTLLNPEAVTSGGLTLPPLRLQVDGETRNGNTAGGPAPRLSPTT